MSRREEIINLLAKKWEGWEYWNGLRGKVKMAEGACLKRKDEIDKLHAELVIIRREGEPMQQKEIKHFGLFATITREEYTSEIKEEAISRMKKELINELGYEGLHDWQIIEYDQIVLVDNDSKVLQGTISPFKLIGTIIPMDGTPVMQLGVKVKKEVLL